MGLPEFKEIVLQAKISNQLERQKKQHDRMLVYMDNFENLVLQKIKKQFNEDNFDRLYPMVATDWNILKKVVNLKSVIYKQQAIRQWMIGDKTKDEKYDEIIQDSNIHIAFQTFNKYVNINNTAFMRVSPDKDRIRYDAIPSELITLLHDDYDIYKYKALLHKIIIDHQDETKNYYLYFDKDQWGRVDYNLEKFIELNDNPWRDPNNGNEGIIPYVPGWSMQPMANSFWNETLNDDLYNITIQSNVHNTHMNNNIKTSCYKQWVFSGLMTEDIKRLYNHVCDGMNPIALMGESSEAKADTMVTDLENTEKVLNDRVARVLDNHGVEYDSQQTTGQAQSGYALKIKQESLDNLREEQEPILRAVEKELAYKTVIVANAELGTNININGDFNILFAKQDIEIETDDIGSLDWQLEKGLFAITDLYQKLHPDVPEDEAEDKVKENIEINKGISGTTENNEIDAMFNEEEEIDEDATT